MCVVIYSCSYCYSWQFNWYIYVGNFYSSNTFHVCWWAYFLYKDIYVCVTQGCNRATSCFGHFLSPTCETYLCTLNGLHVLPRHQESLLHPADIIQGHTSGDRMVTEAIPIKWYLMASNRLKGFTRVGFHFMMLTRWWGQMDLNICKWNIPWWTA